MKWLSKTLTAALAASFATEVYGDNGCLADQCIAGATSLVLSICELTDADFDAIATCFTTAGLDGIEFVSNTKQDGQTPPCGDGCVFVNDRYLAGNSFTTLPSNMFSGMTSLESLSLNANQFTSLDAATFQPVVSTLTALRLYDNQLTTLASGIFDGMTALERLYIRTNPLTTLPSGLFDDLTSVTKLYFSETELTALPSGLFDNMGSLEELFMNDGLLAELEVDAFVGLTSVEHVDFQNNALTTLPEGVFDTLGDGSSLHWLLLFGNDDLQCVPTSPATQTTTSSSSSSSYLDIPTNAGLCECTGVATCDEGLTCSDGTEGYTCDAIVACAVDSDCDTGAGEACCLSKLICEVPDAADPGACGDPHMTGFRGQKFDFTGEDGKWYAVVSDLPYLHLNMRVTAPVPSLPEITYITGISIMTTDDDGFNHAIVISVSDPHSMESVCPVGMPSCLADGALHVVANGEEIMLTPDVVTLAPGVAIAAVNLPGECRSFGFEQYWEQKILQLAQPGRRLSGGDVLQDMSDWVLADPTATNMVECEEYVAAAVDGAGLFEHQSEHASFPIMTPTATIRLSHGRLHQLPMRDPTDQYDLPDHLAWQMNMAIDHNDMSLDATGILGETLVPTLDHTGAPIMQGMDAIRGAQEDYRVSGPLEVFFSQNQHHE